MIQIQNMNFAKLHLDEFGEPAIYGEQLTPFQEHQVCSKIVKWLLAEGIQADVMTNANVHESKVN